MIRARATSELPGLWVGDCLRPWAPSAPLRIDPETARRQVERVRRVRAERDSAGVESALKRLGEAASTPETNTMPAVLECVEAYATVGEICDTLRDVFGEYQAPSS